MSEMFSGCSSLKHLDLRSFDFKTASENNGLTDIFSRTKDLVVIVKDEEQKGYIQAEADKAGVTIKIAGQE